MENQHYPLLSETDERFTALHPEVQQCALIAEINLRKVFRGLSEKHPGILNEKEAGSVFPGDMLLAMMPIFQATDKVLGEVRGLLVLAQQKQAELDQRGRR